MHPPKHLAAVTCATVAIVLAGCGSSHPPASDASDTHGPFITVVTDPPTTYDRGPDTSPATDAPTTTTTVAAARAATFADPDSVADGIGLQASDLPAGAEPQDAPSSGQRTSDACKPVSASPWVSNRSSGSYILFGGPAGISSQVAIEPTVADADAVRATMSSAAWSTNCDLPQNSAGMQDTIDGMGSPCNFTWDTPQEAALPAGQLPAGVAGWRFTALLHCGLTGTTTQVAQDVLVSSVGNIVIDIHSINDGGPSDLLPLEVGVMTNARQRAQQALQQ